MNEYVFFWHEDGPDGIFSNWYPCRFTVNGIRYAHTEQYMMAQKALLFLDDDVFQMIMKEISPRKCKSLGRKVRNFDETVWNREREKIMYEGCYAKFSQDPELKDCLLATGSKIIAEASPLDRIWGIGLSADDPKAYDPKQWRGKNLLGKTLMRVREQFAKE